MITKRSFSVLLLATTAIVSGCTIVSSSTSIKPRSPLQTDLIARTGATEGTSNSSGSSFTQEIDWVGVGGGQLSIDSAELTMRHTPASVVSASGSGTTGLQVFSTGDGFEVAGTRDNTTFFGNFFQPNSLVGRYTETSGSGASLINYVGYSSAGFQTPLSDIVTIARAGSTARYTGSAALELIESNGHTDFAQGVTDVSIDFASNQMSGDLIFSDHAEGGTGFDLSSVTLQVESGSLVGNTFAGTLSADAAQVGASELGPVTMTGSIYGAQGIEIGGSFKATGTSAASGNGIALIGGFLGSQ